MVAQDEREALDGPAHGRRDVVPVVVADDEVAHVYESVHGGREGPRLVPSERHFRGIGQNQQPILGRELSGGCSRRSRTRSRGYDGQTWLPRDAKGDDEREPYDPSAVR